VPRRITFEEISALWETTNTTNGSWWMVQVQPTRDAPKNFTRLRADLELWNPSVVRKRVKRLLAFGGRKDFNDPPTAVGGIHGN